MSPDVEKCLRNADEILLEMEHLMAGSYYRGAIGRAYYAMFQAASAAMLAKNIDTGNRQAIIPAFADAFIKTGLLDGKFEKYFKGAFSARTETEYETFASADHRQGQTTLLRTKEFISACKKLCD